MKRFLVSGIAFTNEGIVVFQERSKKKAIKRIREIDDKSMIIYKKNIRKSKGKYFYKIAITRLDENKIEADNIKAGELHE